MTSIGNHMKFQVDLLHRDRVREFYVDLLGCTALPAPVPNVDLYLMPDGFVLGTFFVPPAEALTLEQCLNATWLEIMTPDPAALIARLMAFGVAPIDYSDKEHFYFHSPGGPVFRIAAASERGPRP
ncbi:MAG: hypothetical protein ABI972_30525 [Acidobacteriota bacterium]